MPQAYAPTGAPSTGLELRPLFFLTPEHLKPFRSSREPDRFQLVTAAVGGHDTIKTRWVRREKRLQVAQEVLQELRLWAIGFQNGPDCRAEFDPVCWRYC